MAPLTLNYRTESSINTFTIPSNWEEERPSWCSPAWMSTDDGLYGSPPGTRLEAGCVRFVHIIPDVLPHERGESTDTIRCQTCIRRTAARQRDFVDDPFTYTALSYVWGDPTPRRPIVLDGQQHLIAENLWHFLREAKSQLNGYVTTLVDRYYPDLSAEDVSYWLWIDALCIDQSNFEERKQQVAIMSWIYKKASQVTVWLGQAYGNSDLVMHALSTRPGQSSEDRAQRKREKVVYLYSCRAMLDGSMAVVQLCQRPYWGRLWVFQELRHATSIKVMCGQKLVSWDAFGNLWLLAGELRQLNRDAAALLGRSLATRMATLRLKKMYPSLWDLLGETRDLICADKRDRVYAVLSVACSGHIGIKADYKASLLSVGHRVLRNRYAAKPPTSLDGVTSDCDSLDQVLFGQRMMGWYTLDDATASWTDLIRYGEITMLSADDRSSHDWANANDQPAVLRLLQGSGEGLSPQSEPVLQGRCAYRWRCESEDALTIVPRPTPKSTTLPH